MKRYSPEQVMPVYPNVRKKACVIQESSLTAPRDERTKTITSPGLGKMAMREASVQTLIGLMLLVGRGASARCH